MKKYYLKKTKKWIYINIIICITIFDILSKYWVIKNIKIYEIKEIFAILNLFHVHNYGAAFNFLSNQGGWQKWFLSVVSIITILVLTKKIIQSKYKDINKNIGCSLVIAGAIGNLIDRIFYGFVIDFIDIHINNWHFAIFNIADCSIFIGILFLLKKNF